jgi:penicillin-binding protein 1A
VSNYDHHDYGQIDLLDATAFSVNTVYAQLITKVGPDLVEETAHEAGINSPLEPLPSLTLGTENVTPLEMAGAYGTLASRGVYHAPYFIDSVKDRDGNVLFHYKPKAENALPSGVADTVTYAMRQVVERGTGTRVALPDRQSAGKTGTTENHVDAWFGGFTPDLVGVAWMGFAEGGRTMENVRGIAVTGGSFPGRIWHEYMVKAHANIPPHKFPEPDFGGETIGPSPVSSSPSPSPSVVPSTTIVPSTTPTKQPGPKKSPTPTPTATASPSPSTQPSAKPSANPDGGG